VEIRSRDDLERLCGELLEENRALLDDLETAYRQMESHLTASQSEMGVAYRELGQRSRNLEGRVRDLERAHQRLRRTEDLLIHAERMAAMGQLAASIVHEIRNPMAVISGEAELMLLRPDLPEDARHRAGQIQAHCEQLSGLIEDILRFSRRQESRVSRVSLNDLVSDLLAFIGHLKGKEARIETALARNLPLVSADPGQIKQVLSNLLVNALDAMPEEKALKIVTEAIPVGAALRRERVSGWPCALILCPEEEALTKDEPSVCVTLSDAGVGIPAHDLRRIFDAFFTTKPSGQGTGIGLSICRTIVERHGGDILVASLPGAGARFSVLLPAAS